MCDSFTDSKVIQMHINEHRKAIVRALMKLSSIADNQLDYAFDPCDQHEQHKLVSICVATYLYFPDYLSQKQTTLSNIGRLWKGLWLDCPLYVHDGNNSCSRIKGEPYHFHTLFPSWLAEVLVEQGFTISTDDIYDMAVIERFG